MAYVERFDVNPRRGEVPFTVRITGQVYPRVIGIPVDHYVDGELTARGSTSPDGSFEWEETVLTPGVHEFWVVVGDQTGRPSPA